MMTKFLKLASEHPMFVLMVLLLISLAAASQVHSRSPHWLVPEQLAWVGCPADVSA